MSWRSSCAGPSTTCSATGRAEPDRTTWLRDGLGGAVYLRLSTRTMQQPQRQMAGDLAEDVIRGAYWLRKPGPNAEIVVAYTGAVAPEAMEAVGLMAEDRRDVGLLAITSADRLYAGWTGAQRAREGRPDRGAQPCRAAVGGGAGPLRAGDGGGRASRDAGLAGFGARPSDALARRVSQFGQTGTIADLYREAGIDADAIVAAAQGLAPGRPIRYGIAS